jgi:hypothetical protein
MPHDLQDINGDTEWTGEGKGEDQIPRHVPPLLLLLLNTPFLPF